MEKVQKVSIVLVIISIFMFGVINNTKVVEITSNYIQMKESNTKDYIDLSTNQVALMNYYMPSSNITLFSGLWIDSVSLEAEEDGLVYIGTAKLDDVLNAKKTGTTLSANTVSYQVTKGTNDIILNIEVPTNSTLVIGGQNSVSIAYEKGTIDTTKENVFTLIDNVSSKDIFSDTNGKHNKLLINVNVANHTYRQLVENYKENAIPISEMRTISGGTSASPWAHVNNNELYENQTITRLDFPLMAVTEINENQIIKVHVIDKTELVASNVVTKKQTYELKIPYNQIKGLDKTAINKWISITGLNIQLKENETLSFGGTGSTVTIGYANTGGQTWQDVGKPNLSQQTYEIYYSGYVSEDFSLTEHIEKIDKEERILSKLKDKKVSILGDSISTFGGYSNDSTTANSTMGNNAAWYSTSHSQVSDVNKTWWMKTINDLQMKLLVNNSSSGSVVFGTDSRSGKTRVEYLHDNTNPDDSSDTNYVVDPDIILIYMGLNDAKTNQNDLSKLGKYEDIKFNELIKNNDDRTYTYAVPTTFAEAYAIMLHKAIIRYSQSDIYVFTLQQPSYSEFGTESIPTTNEIINKLANHYNLELVDLYNNYPKNSTLHPDSNGMATIAQIVEEKLLADAVKAVQKDIEEENKKQEENNNDNQEEVENPYTSTSLIKIISLIIIVGSIVLLVSTFKNTKVNKYE